MDAIIGPHIRRLLQTWQVNPERQQKIQEEIELAKSVLRAPDEPNIVNFPEVLPVGGKPPIRIRK